MAMAVGESEKNRKLSEAEQRRLRGFERLCESMTAQGYRCTELTVSVVRANIVSMLIAIPVTVLGMGLFMLVNLNKDWVLGGNLASIAILLVLVVVHEGIHGLTWSIFAPNHLSDIEFGFMKEYLTPYCTCKTPLAKWPYVAGALAPLVLLGIIPTVVAIATSSFTLLVTGLIMILAAGGDVMIVWMILRHRTTGSELLVLDHPTQAGCAVFER
jgi:hypothetical protein